MAFKEKIVGSLETLLKAEDAVGRLLRRQNIFLVMHPRLGQNKTPEIREELDYLIMSIRAQEKGIRELLCEIKGENKDVY